MWHSSRTLHFSQGTLLNSTNNTSHWFNVDDRSAPEYKELRRPGYEAAPSDPTKARHAAPRLSIQHFTEPRSLTGQDVPSARALAPNDSPAAGLNFDPEDPPHFLLPLLGSGVRRFQLLLAPSPIPWVQQGSYNVHWTAGHSHVRFHFSALPSPRIFVNLGLTHIIQTLDHFYHALLKLLQKLLMFLMIFCVCVWASLFKSPLIVQRITLCPPLGLPYDTNLWSHKHRHYKMKPTGQSWAAYA